MSPPSLPHDFLWGFATASYQVEGAVKQDGRGATNWDEFTSKPGKIADGTSGETACDSYNRMDEDIELLKQTGAQAYRFSLAWSRIIPLGGRNDPVNHKGLQHYVTFVDKLIAAGITPLVTLYHWDLPVELDQRYNGLMNAEEFVADFRNYAKVVFEALAHKVKHFITFNEPWCSSILGYSEGFHAPGRTSNRQKNPVGDASTEPWIVGHNLLVAHGTVVDMYRKEYKEKTGGEIGITLNGDWVYPYDAESQEDIDGCQRKLEFSIAWFADPIYHGDYPASMREQLGSRLPKFTPEQIALVKGSNDFYGMNHYCANYIKQIPGPASPTDFSGNVELLFENNKGDTIGPVTQSPWLRPNPEGFRHLLKWISDRFGHPKIYVTENGTSIKGENDLSKEEMLDDEFRVAYFKNYVKAMAEASALDGIDVRAYMGWSLMDNFEWAEGYETRFGVTLVDYKDDQKRYLKKSGKSLKEIIEQYVKKE